MTRFEMEISGALGTFWKKDAEKELAKVKAELDNGEITIDENGVARNCIGRILMDDMAEKVAYITDKIDRDATRKARKIAVDKSLAEYRQARANHKYSEEEMFEMRSAFGAGTKVVDVLTGQTIQL